MVDLILVDVEFWVPGLNFFGNLVGIWGSWVEFRGFFGWNFGISHLEFQDNFTSPGVVGMVSADVEFCGDSEFLS